MRDRSPLNPDVVVPEPDVSNQPRDHNDDGRVREKCPMRIKHVNNDKPPPGGFSYDVPAASRTHPLLRQVVETSAPASGTHWIYTLNFTLCRVSRQFLLFSLFENRSRLFSKHKKSNSLSSTVSLQLKPEKNSIDTP